MFLVAATQAGLALVSLIPMFPILTSILTYAYAVQVSAVNVRSRSRSHSRP